MILLLLLINEPLVDGTWMDRDGLLSSTQRHKDKEAVIRLRPEYNKTHPQVSSKVTHNTTHVSERQLYATTCSGSAL